MASRTRFLLATALALAVSAGAGCGVSDTSRPVDEGDAIVAANVVGGGEVKQPRLAAAITTIREVVPAFFEAAAGAESDGGEAAVARARARGFLTVAAQARWKPGTELTVVRLRGGISPPVASGDVYTVTVRYQSIGIMTPEGPVTQLADQDEHEYTFEIASEDGQWRLNGAPALLMIRDTALETFYRPNPIYFWDTSRTRLVPDLRYLPLTMPVQQRPSQVVRWLLQGPSPWLRPAVTAFRRDTSLKGLVQSPGGAVTVNLSSNAVDDTDLARRALLHQLRWSLRPYVTESLELQIEGQSKLKDGSDDYLRANMAANAGQPELFGLDKGKVVLKSPQPAAGGPAVLGAAANANVVFAAISTNHTYAAFVAERVGRSSLTVVRVEDDNERPRERLVRGLPTAAIGRPAFISGSEGHLLVPAAGRLYAVGPTGVAAAIAPAVSGVESVSVAPDGRRVAFVARGRAYVAGLSVDLPSISLGSQPRRVLPGPMRAAAIAWISEEQILVAGAIGEDAALFRVTADGAVAEDRSPAEQSLTDIVAFPDSPIGSGAVGDIVAQTETNVIRLFGQNPVVANDLISPFYAGG